MRSWTNRGRGFRTYRGQPNKSHKSQPLVFTERIVKRQGEGAGNTKYIPTCSHSNGNLNWIGGWWEACTWKFQKRFSYATGNQERIFNGKGKPVLLVYRVTKNNKKPVLNKRFVIVTQLGWKLPLNTSLLGISEVPFHMGPYVMRIPVILK